MKCFNCDEEITPEMSIEPTLEGNVNVACFCVECGVTINLFEVGEEDANKALDAFKKACGV